MLSVVWSASTHSTKYSLVSFSILTLVLAHSQVASTKLVKSAASFKLSKKMSTLKYSMAEFWAIVNTNCECNCRYYLYKCIERSYILHSRCVCNNFQKNFECKKTSNYSTRKLERNDHTRALSIKIPTGKVVENTITH